MTPTVSIVCPSYNGRALLENAVPSLLEVQAAYPGQSQVIVVDDGSQDGSAEYLRDQFPTITVVARESQGGFQEACGSGAARATGELLMFVNNDMSFAPNLLQPMVRHFTDDPDVFAVAARSLVTTWESAGSRLTGGPWNEAVTRGRFRRASVDITYPGIVAGKDTSTAFPEVMNVIYAPGGAMMCRADRYRALGGFSHIYRPYLVEDLDLSYRAWKRGWKVLYEPAAVIQHQRSATLGAAPAASRERILVRNFLLFNWSNLTDRGLLASHVALLVPRLVRSLLAGDESFYSGLWAALPRIPEVVAARRRERGVRTRGDRYVVESLWE